MNDATLHDAEPTDELMLRLGAARPATPDELTSSTSASALALRQEILAMTTNTDETVRDETGRYEPLEEPIPMPLGRPARRRWALAVAGLAAATVAVTLISTRDADAPERTPDVAAAPTSSAQSGSGSATSAGNPAVDLADIELIAQRSFSALGHSGRANVVFSSEIEDTPGIADDGTAQIAFSGDDIEMTIDFVGSDESLPNRGGFTVQNKTVDGEFYLLDGPIGDKRWVHDVNESGKSASDLFSIDPRTLLSLFSTDAGLEQVGTEVIGGVTTRHLRSTKPVSSASLNLGLGPVGEGSIDVLDLWVGDDDVTRRVDVQMSQTMMIGDADSLPLVGKNPDGSTTITQKDGTVTVIPKGEPIVMPSPPASSMHERTHRSTYSVTFSDVGAPIEVTPPTDATDIAGQG